MATDLLVITACKTDDHRDEEGGWRRPGEKKRTEELALDRPVARPHLATREDRIECQSLRAAYALYVWNEQKKACVAILPACDHCGLPTGCFCDRCEERNRPWANPICSDCDEDFHYKYCKTCLPRRWKHLVGTTSFLTRREST